MKKYLISLPNAEDRRATLSSSLPKKYSQLNIISAVDGRKKSSLEYYEKIKEHYKKTGKILTPAELGCTLSHIKALKEFLASEEKYALILEDDIISSDNAIEEVARISKKIEGKSILILGGQEGIQSSRFIYGKRISQDENLYKLCKFGIMHTYRTCCYLVTRESAKVILQCHQDELQLADCWQHLNQKYNLKFYFYPIIQHPKDLNDSTIESERIESNRSETLIKKITRKTKKAILLIFTIISGNRQIKTK